MRDAAADVIPFGACARGARCRPYNPRRGDDRGSAGGGGGRRRNVGVAPGAVRRDAGAARRALLDDLRARERAALHARRRHDRLRARPRLPRRLSLHARRLPVDVSRPALDDAAVRGLRHRGGDERALPLPARARADGALDRLRHADADGVRLGPRPVAGGGRARGRRDRLARRRGDALRRDPARRRLDLDDDQRARRDAARVLPLRRRAAGGGAGAAARDDPDGHPQGVHRAEGVDLPARAVAAARGRHGRVLRAGDAALASDLDLRLPHPRGGLERGAGARVHAGGRVRVRGGVHRPRPRRRRLRSAAVVLLQRAPRLLRGDREVPRRAADLGARAARALRREEPALVADALPHADGGRVADGAATRGQHRADGARGARGGPRRDAVSAHELRSTRRSRCRRRTPFGSPSGRSR